jgi:hypothetical protein
MSRDIDFAALAVKGAIVEKFGRKRELNDLTATGNLTTITVRDGQFAIEGTRDQLLTLVRKTETYEQLWEPVRDTASVG